MKLKEKNRYKISIILLIISLVLFISSGFWRTTQIYKTIKIPEMEIETLIQHWVKLPVIQNQIPTGFWEKKVILVFIFSMTDCSICLPRVDQLVNYSDSLKNILDFNILCIGISKNKRILERYLLVAKKPCPVIYEDQSKIEYDYGRTPQFMLIDRRNTLKIYKGFIPKKNLKKINFSELRLLLEN